MIIEPRMEAAKRKNHLILVRGFVVQILSKLANEGTLFAAKRGQNIIKAHHINGRTRKNNVSFLLVWFSTKKIRPMKIGKYDMTMISATIARMHTFCVHSIIGATGIWLGSSLIILVTFSFLQYLCDKSAGGFCSIAY
jgi:hypothetical protein